MAVPKWIRVWRLNPKWKLTVENIIIDDYLSGNIVPIRKVERQHRSDYRNTLAKLALAAARSGYSKNKKLYVSSSYRFRADQQRVYDLYMAGKGPLAARPGTSMHERGLAVDVPNAREKTRFIRQARALGLKDDVASEKWHLTNHRS